MIIYRIFKYFSFFNYTDGSGGDTDGSGGDTNGGGGDTDGGGGGGMINKIIFIIID